MYLKTKVFITRMHSNRMRTARSLPCGRGVSIWGVSIQGVSVGWSRPLNRDRPGQRTPLDRTPWTETPSGQRPPLDRDPLERDPPEERPPDRDIPWTEILRTKNPLWTELQTGVKTLPCRNFVAGGNFSSKKSSTKP